jgi:hypothetical protein
MKRIIISLFSVLSFFSARSEGAPSTGRSIKTQAPFLLLPTDARGSGMGEIGAATEPDVYSYYWNPAKLAFIEDKIGIAVAYTPWLRNLGVSDVNINSVDAYYKIDKLQTAALSFTYFGMGNIQYTDGSGKVINDFSPNEFSLGVSYARKFTDKLSFAMNAKLIYSNLAGEIQLGNGSAETKPATAFAADVAGYYVTEYELGSMKIENSYGLNISNLGSKISYTDNQKAAMPIPSNIRFGTSFKTKIDEFSDIRLSLEVIKLMVPTPSTNPAEDPNYTVIEGMLRSFGDAPGGFSEEMDEITPSLGLEYMYSNTFAIRAGYMMESNTKGAREYLTLGLGLVYNAFNFDVSYYKPTGDVDSPLNNQLKFSLSFRFSAPKPGQTVRF